MLVNRKAFQVQGANHARHFHLATVELLQQHGQGGRNEVYHALAQRVLRRQAGSLAHRLLGPLGIAAPQLGQALDIGHRVVDDLAFHGRARLGRSRGALSALVRRLGVGQARHGGRAYLHRGGRPQVGTRRHGRDLGGIQQVSSGACGAGATGSHVAHYRQLRRENRLDHLAHGNIQTTRGVYAQHQQLGAGLLGGGQSPHHVVGGGRTDGSLHVQQPDIRMARRGKGHPQAGKKRHRQPGLHVFFEVHHSNQYLRIEV